MPTALSSTDFDKDGDIDIVSVNGSGLVLILSNDGTGLFSPVAALQINLVSSVDYKALDVEDFDGDGRPDIALGVSNKAVIIKNNSNNTLSILYEANISSSPYTSPVAADIDGDGDIDVALTTGSSVTLIKNNGAGNFTTSTIGSTGSGARGISAADLDGDNDMDIVSTNTTGNNLTVFFNNLPPTISTIANQSICINATKNVNFTVNDAQTPLQDLVLTANSLNIALIPVANLTITGSGSNRTLSIVPVAGQTGTSDITLTVTDHNNAAVSVTFTITVNPLPTVIASASPSSICSGSSTNLSVTGAISYLWSPATTLDNSTIANPIATLPTPGNYSYQVVGTDANGCSNSTSVNVTVNQVSVNIGASPSATICPGTNVIFTATPTNGGITPSYQWKVGSTSVGTNSSTYSTSGLINGEIVTCILTSSDVTCITGNPATSNALPITVNALPPTPIMTVSPTTICQDGIVNVSCTSPPSPYTSTYTRPAGSTIMGGGGGPGGFGESVKVTQTGNFVFTYINPTTSCTNSTIQTVTVNPCSVSLGTVTPLNLCAGGAIQIPYTSMGTSSSTVYVVLLVYSSGPNVTLGTMTGVPSIGTFNLTIPANTPVGKNYRVKIVTSYPSLSSPNNADDITISRDCGAYGFNGTDSRILIPSNTAYNFGTGNFTLEAWVKMDATSSGNSPIISKRIIGSTSGSFMLSANAGTQLLLQINGVDVLSSSFTSIYDNTCHHVAVSRSGSTISFYLDGILKGTSSNAGSISSTNSLKIGHDSFDNTNLKGNVDEVRIWDIARTASEILNNKSTVIAANTYGLKGYWQMNESAGQTVYDATLTVNNGTLGTDAANADAQDPTRLSQGACYVPALQSGLTFDGTLDRVTIPHHSSYDIGSGDFTIEAWVRLQSGSNGKPILSKRTTYSDGFLLMPYTSGTQLLLQLNGVPNYLSSTFPSILDNICHHIAVTRSGSTITFYVDGVAYGTVSSTRSLNSTGPLYIGYDIKDNSTINGQINEVQIWNQALSASSIQSGMTTEVYPGGASALKGYWKLKEPSGQTVVDLSTTANSGYLGTNSLQFDAQDPIRSAFSCYSADRMGYGLSDVADFVADSSMIGAFSGVKIYPNPFMKETNIVITGTEKGEGELSILDLSGRLMWGDSFLINEVKTINLPLPAGVYIVRIKRNDKTEIYRIMKTE
jgi:hypothetical protein